MPPRMAPHCAARGTLGKRLKKIPASGEYEVCLSESQLKTLFHARHVPKRIGCGAFACAYPRGTTEVVKITRDRDDVNGMVAGQPTGRVARVLAVHELHNAGTDLRTKRPIPVFAVVVERLQPLTDSERKWYGKIMQKARTGTVKHFEKWRKHGSSVATYSVTPEEKAHIIDKSCRGNMRGEKCRRFVAEFTSTWQKLLNRGLLWVDSHSGNIAWDGKGGWKVIDLGFSGSKRNVQLPVLRGAEAEAGWSRKKRRA